eukprot:2187841-Pyramimonas_sp.AAC.1
MTAARPTGALSTARPPHGSGVWRVVEDGNSLGYAAGQELKPVTTFIGCKGVYSPDGKEAAFVEFSDDDQADFVKRASARAPAEATPVQDARQLSIKYNPQGRVREWRDVVD